MFADLDEGLRQLLIREVPLNPNEIDVTFDRPDRESVARFSRPTVDLFLFDVLENKELRQTGWQAESNGNGRAVLRWPALRVDLRYLVTVWASEVEDQHRLLFHLYRAFQRLPELPEDLWEGTLANQPSPPRLEVEEGDRRMLLDLWGVLDNRLQPSIVLKATVAVDLNATREAPLVGTSTLRTRPFRQQRETRQVIGGAVRDGQGQPIAGARVRLAGRVVPVATDESGRFRLTGVAGTRIDLSVEADGFRPDARAVEVPGSYDIVLEPANVPPPPRGRRGGGR